MVVHNFPVTGPTVWDAGLDTAAWTIECSDVEIQDLGKLVQKLTEHRVTLETLNPEDATSHVMRTLASRISSLLHEGPGLVLVRLWPVEAWGEQACGMLFWTLGGLMGSPLSQNDRGDRLSIVRREVTSDEKLAESSRRGSHSDQEIDFHTENARPPQPPRVIGLMCCRAAREGGDSSFVSGHTIYNRLLQESPEVVKVLRQSFMFGRPAGEWQDKRVADAQSVFGDSPDGLQVRFNRYWMDRGAEICGKPLSQDIDASAAIEAFESQMRYPDLVVTHRMLPGEMVFVNNHVVLHSRSAFRDGQDPKEWRMLWRLWYAQVLETTAAR